ncbi:cytochrome c oxidase, subunit VIa [Neoconidiobolus thromboides FSU 785]|nr:cytochrome c oxidase, subunit VIa [Neoconidiobolus thromboides FSU 785]
MLTSRLFFNSTKASARSSLRQYSSTASSSAREKYFEELKHTQEHAKKATNTWRLISLYVAGPILIVTSYNAYRIAKDHEEHMKHHPYEFKPWPHLRIRNKAFPFGDGDHTLFHNPSINLDPPKDN